MFGPGLDTKLLASFGFHMTQNFHFRWARSTPLRAPVLGVLVALFSHLIGCSSDDPLRVRKPRGDASADGMWDAGDASATGTAGSAGFEPDGGRGGTTVVVNANCGHVEATHLRARRAILSQDADDNASSGDQTITLTKAGLFDDFSRAGCATSACHGGADLPLAQSPTPFKVTSGSFDQRPNLGKQALERILNSDPTKVMPPGSGDGSMRREDDPIRILGEQLVLWQEAGFPAELQIVTENGEEEGSQEDPYLLGAALGDSLTNLGSCLPTNKIEHKVDEMRALDQMFASAQTLDDLPETLPDTDLVSLDSELLARRGVYSYAPTYTLFSDNAEKMRYVRVPVGEAITYNAETKEFDIPENTRFYKTFLRKVIDKDGKVGYRKMETRLIVSRANEELPDGTFKTRALRVVYAWDRNERMARKVQDPLRSGQPWSDRLCPYITDESVSRAPPPPDVDGGAPNASDNPIIEHVSQTCTYMTQEERDDPDSGRIRHYAIPSVERCDQCHMGSHSKSYILGFTPYHADRRPMGEGGVYEDATEDELGQLQRLIDYGVVRGIEPGQAKLEESQEDRRPRNDYELTAQAYMMGNCAFCHNPNGFPTVQNPVLAGFNMFPSDVGGVFQFPLEKYSPRAKFGPNQTVRFPYITPAFGNHLGGLAQTTAKQFSFTIAPVVDVHTGVNSAGFPIWINEGAPDVIYNRFNTGATGEPIAPVFQYLGPWRSLIWRNVYTPFTYSEDGAIFIHMPRNVPGFDCRAQKIMASWMLSIPSRDCRTPLDATEAPDCPGKKAQLLPGQVLYNLDQPFEEILPGQDGYNGAVKDGEERVEDYLKGVTGTHCPVDDDIVDPEVLLSPTVLGSDRKEYTAPADQGALPPNGPRVVEDPAAWVQSDGVPEHAHWVPFDATDDFSHGWLPRRSNWEAMLVDRSVPVNADLNRVIDELLQIHLSDAQQDFAVKPQPMGRWHPDCWKDLDPQLNPTISDLRVRALSRQASNLDDLELWTLDNDSTGGPIPSYEFVHYQSRGEAVFRAICQNCHGRQADSRSPLAATIGELTGGETRVANFVDGMLGPRAAPGQFADDVFRINRGASAAEWQVRYMLFMGLGGTEAVIPQIAVSLVKTSPFYGIAVQAGGSSGANMLQAAQGKCDLWLQSLWSVSTDTGSWRMKNKSGSFLGGTGEYELWEALCGYQNEPVVRVLRPSLGLNVPFEANSVVGYLYRAKDDAGEWVYPPDAPVGNRLGKIQLGIQANNYLPWCVVPTSVLPYDELVARFAEFGVHESMMPICPPELFATAFGGQEIHQLDFSPTAFNAKALSRIRRRGAMNAGMAAYFYLDGVTKGTLQPAPAYDTCGENQ